MDVEVVPGGVAGRARPPPSKSATHRALVLAAVGGGGRVHRPLRSADTRATATLLEAMGASVSLDAEPAVVDAPPAGRLRPPTEVVDCANSGTTLRLGAGLAATVDGRTVLTGDASLRRRPNAPLLGALERLGATAEGSGAMGEAPVTVAGPIEGGPTTLEASTSSQFLSSLLLAGSLVHRELAVEVVDGVASRPYVTLTREALALAGVEVTDGDGRYVVPAGATPRTPPAGFTVGVDPTSASYLLAAGALAGRPDVGVTGLDGGLRRPLPVRDHLAAMDLPLEADGDALVVGQGRPAPATVDLGACPDLLPTVGVLAGVADGTSRLVNCPQARHKESDRIAATADLLRCLGVEVRELADGLVVEGRPAGFEGGVVESGGDHRLAMAGAVAGLAASRPVRVRDGDAVAVSYPDFFEALADLGADVRPVR
ncbi:MAG: 3-phosphoshikimate 1-carboxyvinyltransferase [Halobacteriales archaeon]